MSRLMISRRLGILSLAVGALPLLMQSNCLASVEQQQEQQQSQQTPPPPPAPPQNSQPASQQAPPTDQPIGKHRKVWTNDDVVLLRTPADNYLAEKEAKEATEAEAAAKLAAQPKVAKEVPLEINLPTSIEETQLLIKNKEQDISDDQATLASLNAELATAAEEQKKAKQKEIEIVAAELDRARSELKALQDHLVELHRPSARPASQAPAAPPPPPPN
jgi:hypothetical protein